MATTNNDSGPDNMAISSLPLPDTLLAIMGPGVSDPDCPICQCPFDEDSSTVEHPDCKRRFGEECIQMWLTKSKTRTCPVCRGQLMEPDEEAEDDEEEEEGEEDNDEPEDEEENEETSTRAEDDWELMGEDMQAAQLFLASYCFPTNVTLNRLRLMTTTQLAVYTVDKRTHLPGPSEWHVASDERQLRNIIQSLYPDVSAEKLLDLVTTEVDLTLNVVHTHPYRHLIGFQHSEELIQHSSYYEFNTASLQCLWTSSRAFGVCRWFCLRFGGLPRAEHIAVWIPFPENITALINENELSQCLSPTTYQELTSGGLPTDLVPIPLPTDLLAERFSWFDPEEELTTGTEKLKEIAEELDVTHWALVGVMEEGPYPRIYALPWPEEKVEEGFEMLTFPGWSARRSDVQGLGGWQAEVAERCLASFLWERRGRYRLGRLLDDES